MPHHLFFSIKLTGASFAGGRFARGRSPSSPGCHWILSLRTVTLAGAPSLAWSAAGARRFIPAVSLAPCAARSADSATGRRHLSLSVTSISTPGRQMLVVD